MGNKILLAWLGPLLAQIATDGAAKAISPSLLPPELGLIVQLGSFGLVAYAVVWMYPREADKARKERADREAAAAQERRERDKLFTDALTAQQGLFETRQKALTDSVNSQTTTLAAAFAASSQTIERAVTNVCKGRTYLPLLPGEKQ